MRCVEEAVSYAVDEVEDASWYAVLDTFQDATIFQTPAFCRAKAPGARLEQLVVRRGREVIAAALIRLLPIPFARTSIAYILWGPVCHRWGCSRDVTALRHAFKVLREEYVVRRGFGLRIAPLLTRDDDAEWLSLLRAQGYRHLVPPTGRRTIVLELDRPVDELRRGLDHRWRRCLNSAEKQNLVIRQGDGPELFDLFLTVYREMLDRKRLAEPGDIRGFRIAQRMLPDRLKLQVFIALEDGTPAAGVICSAIGGRGVFAFGATGALGMKNRASYLLHWRVIEWLKARGCALYDLHGSDAKANPGGYVFKIGLCGRNGREVEFLGHFEASGDARSWLLLKAADKGNNMYKRLKAVGGRMTGFRG